ncbi:MAG: endolytic transglycosylase MltG [Candidatus Moraniibacteriota bacterium]
MRRIYLAIIGIILVFSLCYVYFNNKLHGRASNSQVEQSFSIKEGEGVNPIATRLQKSGLVSHRLWFEFYIWSQNRESNIVTGIYNLRPSMTIPEIVDIITSGKGNKEDQTVTLIEGWDNNQIGEHLAGKGVISKEDFLQEASLLEKYRPYYSFLADLHKNRTLEGYLFPDTYNVIVGKTTPEQLVYRMLLNFNQKLTDTMKEDVKKSGHKLDEIIIMASIVEREVPNEEDRKIVSGIFWKRIQQKQPLQSCATISYILGVNKKQYSFEDTRVDSPYNTYIKKGLPPGPIGNPGLAAIKAAIYPQDSDFVYFLSDPKTGETIFSRTLDEHNQAKAEHGL